MPAKKTTTSSTSRRLTTKKSNGETQKTPRRKAGTRKANNGIKATERQRMIEEAAYFLAERRDFAGGDSVGDWLAAEAEVDSRLGGKRPTRRSSARAS